MAPHKTKTPEENSAQLHARVDCELQSLTRFQEIHHYSFHANYTVYTIDYPVVHFLVK